MPAAAGEILEHDGEAAVGQHQLGVGPAHRRVGPPALLDDPALAHLLDRAVVEPHGNAVAADLDLSGLHLGEAAQRDWWVLAGRAHAIGEQSSISTPLGSRTYETVWPHGFCLGPDSSRAPASRARAWVAGTSSSTSAISSAAGGPDGSWATKPPGRFAFPISCDANESVVAPVSSSP